MNYPYDTTIDECPNLYKHCKGIECGPGWFDLIDTLSRKLEKIIIKIEDLEDHEKPYASQVKEKFGGLRFYMSLENKEISQLIEEAEIKSKEICEICGKKGEMRKKYGWYSCLCDKCKNVN